MAPLEFYLLGTGTSTGLPLTPCLTLSHTYPEAFSSHVPRPKLPAPGTAAPAGYYDPEGPWPRNVECACCRSAVDPDVPEGWKNNRGNTSAIVRRKGPDGKYLNILVDCGKTFIQQARRWFPRWGVQTIDAVLLTHGHADAYFGLDDLREWCVRQRRAIPIYLDQPTYEIIAKSFPYLVDAGQASGGGDVPTLRWNVIDELSSFDVCGIPVKAFPAHHGVYFSDPPKSNGVKSTKPAVPRPLICLAFLFDEKVLYMGDVSEIPERTWNALGVKRRRKSTTKKETGQKAKQNGVEAKQNGDKAPYEPASEGKTTETASGFSVSDTISPNTVESSNGSSPSLPIFIVDALWPLKSHFSHFSLAQAMAAALELKPGITYTIGSTHPTTHFMWEEVCRSFNEKDGLRPDHPDAEISRGLVEKVKKDATFNGKDKLAERWAEWGGKIEPGYDGLGLEIQDDGSWKEIELKGRRVL